MRNVKEFKTTLTGLIVWIATGLYFVTPYFSEKKLWEVDHMWVAAGVLGGLLLILAPDRMINFIFGFMNRKTGKQ